MITSRDRSHIERALRVASASTQRQRHGCVLAVGNRVLAVGVNTYRAHPSTVSDPKTQAAFHAEVTVLRQLRNHPGLDRATLYVARLNRNDEAALSAPCPRCQGAIDQANVRRVVYTLDSREVAEWVL